MNCPHCNTHIDEHPASRCLDAWVAKSVMRLEVYMSHDEYLRAGFPHAQYWSSAVHYPAYWWDKGWAMSVAPYSSDIAAAWQVMEKLKLSLFPMINGWSAGQYYKSHPAEAPTAPLAISRAAIKSVVRDGN